MRSAEIRRGIGAAGRAAVLGAAFGLTSAASAQMVIIPPPLPVQYDLGATYMQGCFGACLCPIMFIDEVSGSFKLTPVTLTGTLDSYAVTDLTMTIDGPGPVGPRVTGSGAYQIFSEFAVTHRLQLDLTTGPDGAVEHFDSGWVVGGFEFPAIDITVSIGGMKCFDTVFEISATPTVFNPADLNLDGHVNGLDSALLLGAWGRLDLPAHGGRGEYISVGSPRTVRG